MTARRDEGGDSASIPWLSETCAVNRSNLSAGDRRAEETLGDAMPRGEARALPRIMIGDDAQQSDFVSLERISSGGMAVVERALQCSIDREVALKRLHADHGEGAVTALIWEARALAHLDHPNIPTVFALGRDANDLPVMVMKYIEGASWHALLGEPRHPLWRALVGERLAVHLGVLVHVADAVAHAHGRSWLHRDIKPSNVMVTARGEVYLIDWGIALRLPVEAPQDGSGTALSGTPRYMAPEMLRGVGPWLTPRTDVYLLGASLHEVLTGRGRHDGSNLDAVLFAASQSTHYDYPERVPAALAKLANESTHRDPEHRPPSATAFRRRVEAFLHGSLAVNS